MCSNASTQKKHYPLPKHVACRPLTERQQKLATDRQNKSKPSTTQNCVLPFMHRTNIVKKTIHWKSGFTLFIICILTTAKYI